MFLPKAHFKEGAGFSNLEYGLMAEYLGKSRTASEVCRTSVWEEKVDVDKVTGDQLLGSRHGQYGGDCQVRFGCSEAAVARPAAQGRDPLCVFDDRASGGIK